MNVHARRENNRTLAAIAEIAEEQAADLLNVVVAITCERANVGAAKCADHLHALLQRTVTEVSPEPRSDREQPVAVEIIIGAVTPRFSARHIYVGANEDAVSVSAKESDMCWQTIHPVAGVIAACYAAAAALKAAVGEALPFRVPDPLRFDLRQLLGPDLPLLAKPVRFEKSHLAGAGAIGNGFIYGLSQFDVSGELDIADDDDVSEGNIQRCMFFENEHLGADKAEVLASATMRVLPRVTAVGQSVRIQNHPDRRAGPWLKRMIVGVDSPRARRALQNEMPGEVYDASTTGISEIVLHFHKQPTKNACLGCIYPHTVQEDAHEQHVADLLGVSVIEIRQARISSAAAERIRTRYPDLEPSELIGLAYDTLFKRLCSTAKLVTAEDRQVLTPFAFVSVLAGTLIAIEFVRRIQRGHDGLYNEWRISPWANPVFRRQRLLPKSPACELCGNPTLLSLIGEIWNGSRAE